MLRGRGFSRGRGGRSPGQQSPSQRTPSPLFSQSSHNAARNLLSPGSQRFPGQRSPDWLSPPNQAERWPSPSIEQKKNVANDIWSSSSGFTRGRGGRSRGQQSPSQRTPSPLFSQSSQNAARNLLSPGSQRLPGQRSPGWLSPPNQAERWPSPPIEQKKNVEDDIWSSSSEDDTSDSDDSLDFAVRCKIDCDCMQCFTPGADRGQRSGSNQQARSYIETGNSDKQLDQILNEIPLPFVQLWNFTNVIKPKLKDHYLTIMQGYIRKIEAALNFAISRDVIESRLMQAMNLRSQDMEPNMPFFSKTTAINLSKSGQDDNHEELVTRRKYVIPTEILRYAYDANNGVPIGLLGKILAEMMYRQYADYVRSVELELRASGLIRENQKIGYEVDRKQFFQDFLNQFNNYSSARRSFLKYEIYTRSLAESLNPGTQGTPGQQQSPGQPRSPREQQQLRSHMRHRRPDGSVLPPNWIKRIPELPVELRYIMAMIEDYERNRPPYVISRRMNQFQMRNLIYAYMLKMLRDHLHVSLEDAAYEKVRLWEGVDYLERKAVEVNDLEERCGVPWRQRLPALNISQRVPNCILELDSFMMGSEYPRLDYSYILATLFCGLQAEARKAESGVYPDRIQREIQLRAYMLQCELAEKERRRIARN